MSATRVKINIKVTFVIKKVQLRNVPTQITLLVYWENITYNFEQSFCCL